MAQQDILTPEPMNNELMEQCRREAEELHPTAIPGIIDDWQRTLLIQAYAAALYNERSKGGLRYRSECSGLWYTNREAAGDVDAVEVDGVVYVSNKQGKMLDKWRELTDEEFDTIVNNWKHGERGVTIAHRMCFADGLRYARDNYLSTGLTVERAEMIGMAALDEWNSSGWGLDSNVKHFRQILRARLTEAAKH